MFLVLDVYLYSWNILEYEPKWTPETAPKYRFGTGLRKELYDSELKKNPGRIFDIR